MSKHIKVEIGDYHLIIPVNENSRGLLNVLAEAQVAVTAWSKDYKKHAIVWSDTKIELGFIDQTRILTQEELESKPVEVTAAEPSVPPPLRTTAPVEDNDLF